MKGALKTASATLWLPAVLVSVSACGSGLKGKYETHATGPFASDVQQSIEFKSNGKANYDTGMGTIEVAFERDGQEVKLSSPQGTLVGKIDDKGCIDFQLPGGPLCKAVK